MVYCGSGTETTTIIFFILMIKILWSTAEAVLRHFCLSVIIICVDPMVYCGSGTETSFAEGVPVINTLYGKGIPASFRDNFSTTVPAFEADWKANLDKFKR
mgnify:CR=1 FL=1